ncbi:restriction endonuclease [Domibacillus indicus]|uniref:restriction endonuclease n=1 Tax=Domibacillus indicus TaxID=1437523 RepID=UPI00203F74BA|nr:restriction endonuclease [Domibacillus indicus]MCM3791080.1 restriction endonuclease [Domibacillus indicus]
MAKNKPKKSPQLLSNQLLISFLILLVILHYAADHLLAAGIALLFMMTSAALYFYFQWQRQKSAKNKMVQSGIKEIDVMNGREFENYLGALFEAMGYEVEVTPASGDYGADLLMEKDETFIVVQAKRYSKAVGISSIQEVFSAKMYYQADEAWVVTNNTFSKNAFELAKRSGVKLIARRELIELITENMAETPPPVFTIHTWNEK